MSLLVQLLFVVEVARGILRNRLLARHDRMEGSRVHPWASRGHGAVGGSLRVTVQRCQRQLEVICKCGRSRIIAAKLRLVVRDPMKRSQVPGLKSGFQWRHYGALSLLYERHPILRSGC